MNIPPIKNGWMFVKGGWKNESDNKFHHRRCAVKKAVFLGIVASLFFSITFILNKQMNISGGSWIWSASLRYIFMLPILLVIVTATNRLNEVLRDIIKKPVRWIIWSTVGFGLFYAPLCLASNYGPSWLIAGTWQITIVAGALLSPLFFKIIKTENGNLKIRNKIPSKSLLMSSVILVGILLMQIQEARKISFSEAAIGVTLVIIAAFSYPLGNRKMMEECDNKLSTIQRVFGMTLCSMPLWIILSIIEFSATGLPSYSQTIQSLIVAVFSGIIATILFFKATELVKNDAHSLAAVESTQSGEVMFTLLGGVLVFNDKLPTVIGLIGILFVVIGMLLNSFLTSKSSNSQFQNTNI
jgi:drug/metabolite transporter (DMT)-like permease